MTIHHAQRRKAEKLGIALNEVGDRVEAFIPRFNSRIQANTAAGAIQQAEAIIAIKAIDDQIVLKQQADEPTLVTAHWMGKRAVGGATTPIAWHSAIKDDRISWEVEPDEEEVEVTDEQMDQFEEDDSETVAAIAKDGLEPIQRSMEAEADKVEAAEAVERIKGIPIDGKIAYSEGITAADCPYTSETDSDEEYQNFLRWNEEWDAAADEATGDEEAKTSGSVVKPHYRAKYAELGHPNHCGDWMADTLNAVCLTKDGAFMLEPFEAICEANGVNLAKYDRTKNGWLGRLRMTGRNLLSSKVYANGGKMLMPDGSIKQAPEDWMATRKYVKKSA